MIRKEVEVGNGESIDMSEVDAATIVVITRGNATEDANREIEVVPDVVTDDRIVASPTSSLKAVQIPIQTS